MSGPSSDLVHRAIDLNYANQRRSMALKWIGVNSVILTVIIYDLSHKCPDYTSWLHYVELGFAVGLAVSILTHAFQMKSFNITPRIITPLQMRLLGLKKEDLDSSLQLSSPCSSPYSSESEHEESFSWDISPNMSGSADFSPMRTPPYTPTTIDTTRVSRSPRDEFIADHSQLEEFLREHSPKTIEDWRPTVPNTSAHWRPYSILPPADQHQLSTVNSDNSTSEENGEATAEHVWRRLHVDPTHLTQFNLNLRRWIHETVLVRVVKQMDTVDQLLARNGHEARVGEVAPARLKTLSTTVLNYQLACKLRELVLFLREHPDQRYYVSRIRELARGGTLSGYRWDGGNDDWKPPRPTDSEIILELFEAYMFVMSGVVISKGTPRIVKTSPSHPPHFVLCLEKDTLDVGRGRNNLFHTLLVFIAAACRSGSSAICRLNVGPAGLNMLWVIGR